MREKNILLLLLKNTSVLDYSLPLLWKLREEGAGRLSVLYCTADRRRILRQSRFFSAALGRFGVAERDLADYAPPLLRPAAGLARRCWGASPWDAAGTGGLLSGRWAGFTRRLERFFTGRADLQRALREAAPDLVLYDNRSGAFSLPDRLAAWFDECRPRTILLPHAPHHTGTEAFSPFNRNGDPLPDFCEYWTPFLYDRPWKNVPEKRARFFHAGYPGLDGEWLQWLRAEGRTLVPRARADRAGRHGKKIRCLFIIRKFLPSGLERPPGHDAYVFLYEQFMYYLRLVEKALKAVEATGTETELIVKPHPSNNYPLLRATMKGTDIPSWRITYEPIYAETTDCDLVISLYSTTLLIPAAAGVPVVLLHSPVQDDIHQWKEMRELYSGLSHYLKDPEELPDRLLQIAGELRNLDPRAGAEPGGVSWSADTAHVRRFYPDGALQRCLQRLKGAGALK